MLGGPFCVWFLPCADLNFQCICVRKASTGDSEALPMGGTWGAVGGAWEPVGGAWSQWVESESQ